MLVRFPQPSGHRRVLQLRPVRRDWSSPCRSTARPARSPGPPSTSRVPRRTPATLANSLRRITLDDALSAQNPPTLRHPNGDPFSLANRFRGGDTVQNTVGVLGYDFSLYRILPTGPADYTAVNPRPAAPEPVGGSLRVAAMNTLNYFVTLDYPTGDPLDNKCGPAQQRRVPRRRLRPADEFTRQRDQAARRARRPRCRRHRPQRDREHDRRRAAGRHRGRDLPGLRLHRHRHDRHRRDPGRA